MKTEDIKTLADAVEKAFPGLEIYTFSYDIQFDTLYVQTKDKTYFDNIPVSEETSKYNDCVFHKKTVGIAQVLYLEDLALRA